MTRGGARQGAGRKSPWSSSETRAIRIPEYLADEVLAFAKKLDRERSLAARQERLADLLEEFLQLSQENKQEWVEKLPDVYQDVILNAEIRRGLFKSQTITFETYPDDESDEKPISLGIQCTVKDFGTFRIVELSNGQQIKLESQNGRLTCPAMGSPQRDRVSLFVDDDDGKVYLTICSDWNIDHLVSASPVSIEQFSLELNSDNSAGLTPTRKKKQAKAAKTPQK